MFFIIVLDRIMVEVEKVKNWVGPRGAFDHSLIFLQMENDDLKPLEPFKFTIIRCRMGVSMRWLSCSGSMSIMIMKNQLCFNLM
jgi:hypothetical protein